MITNKKIKNINNQLKYEELITDIYDKTWLNKYIKILSENTSKLFNLFKDCFKNKNLNNIAMEITINDICTNIPSDINKFKEIYYSD